MINENTKNADKLKTAKQVAHRSIRLSQDVIEWSDWRLNVARNPVRVKKYKKMGFLPESVYLYVTPTTHFYDGLLQIRVSTHPNKDSHNPPDRVTTEFDDGRSLTTDFLEIYHGKPNNSKIQRWVREWVKDNPLPDTIKETIKYLQEHKNK